MTQLATHAWPPSDETLLRYAAGSLGAGLSLVVAAHLETCPSCRARAQAFERLGGALLEASEPAPMSADAFAQTLDRLDHAPSAGSARALRNPSHLGIALPAALSACRVGPWRWVAPGLRRSWITAPGGGNDKVMLLRGRPGLKLPAHGHDGMEFTLVLHGSLHDTRGVFHAGDFDEADADVDHQPIVGAESECVCLAAVDGGMVMHDRLSRWLSPILGF